jgi:hypothetical protein
MGQPDIVHEFLDLASHTALWNNRRGAAREASALLGSEIIGEELRSTVLLERMAIKGAASPGTLR